jgi:hypothetical protein
LAVTGAVQIDIPAADITPSVDGSHLHIEGGVIMTDNQTSASGTATVYNQFSIEAVTLAATNASVTTTDAATLYVSNAPTAGTNQTLTNAYALWVDDGSSRFDGAATVGGTLAVTGATTLNGAVTLGNAIADDIVVTGYVASHIIPKTDSAYDLGTTLLGFNDIHLGSGGVINMDGGDVTLTHAAGKVTLGGDGAVEFDFANHEMTNVDINSGAIDGSTIGAASASTGAFTTLTASGATTLNGNVTLGDAVADSITMAGKLGDVTMNNGATIVNTNADTLTITEATTAFVGIVTVSSNLSVAGDIIIDDGGSLKEAGGEAAFTFDSSGEVTKIGQSTHTNGLYLKLTSGKAVWASASSSIDELTDGKSGGTDFTNSLILGHADTGTLDAAENNTAVGIAAMDAIESADDNTCLGYNSGSAITTGSSNVLIGSGAGVATLLVGSTVIIGKGAGAGVMTADADGTVAIGESAGAALTSGQYNTAIGFSSLLVETIGDQNTAVGYQSLVSQIGTDGLVGNTAVGYNSGQFATTATGSTFIGNQAGQGITGTKLTGNNNTAVGHKAGLLLQGAGHSNTIIGSSSGDALTSGSNNTVIGYNAAASAVDATNEITLGDTEVDTLRCGTSTIAALSDRRDKTDIYDSSYGINFIEKLRPVQFTWAKRNGGESFNGKRRLGFIAQEFQDAMPDGENEILDLVYESNPERLEAKYGNLIPILTKSVQELAAKSAVLEEENKQLKERLNRLEEIVNTLL